VRLVVDLASAPCPLHGDPGHLEQIVWNLAVNARDALGPNGRIEVATRAAPACASAPDPTRRVHPWVQLVVRDDGCGMTDDVKTHLFEPFFTTKELGKGTGLGLATVYGIVQQMGGHLHVETAPGCGNAFTLCLPRDESPVDPLVSELGDDVRGGSETVLLVEDEPTIRDIVQRILASADYRVLPCDGGESALARAASEPGPIDLVLTDVVMAGIDGVELAHRLTAARPGLRVLLMTGYVDRELSGAPAVLASPLLHKPFTTAELLARVRAALAPRARAATA
jgi:CheY-like chemotaxis protein